MFEASSFCSTSSMSSGETTFSGNSRFKSSYDKNFLSPPNCSNRSITSSLSFSSIAIFVSVQLPAQSRLIDRVARSRLRQERAALLRQFQKLHRKAVTPLVIACPLCFGDFRPQLVDAAIEFHQAQGIQASLSLRHRFIERLGLFVHHQTRQQLTRRGVIGGCFTQRIKADFTLFLIELNERPKNLRCRQPCVILVLQTRQNDLSQLLICQQQR